MHRGYIKLWRKSQESRVFQNADLWKVWTWCLMRANHKEEWVTLKTGKGDIDVFVKPGQFVFGRHSAAKKLRMKPSSVRNRIKKLENMQNLTIKQDNQYSIISICNWDIYQPKKIEEGQEEGQPKDRQRTTKGQAKDTEKNDNNYKNEEKEEQIPVLEPDIAVDFYLTKRNRKLRGVKLGWFNVFWKIFNLPKGKADAADAWLDILNLDEELYQTILDGAKFAADERKQNGTKKPKWAQGWLNGKRWEDRPIPKTMFDGVVSDKTARTMQNVKEWVQEGS